MTNPTSNFGWQMPTSTDLVTDLPADFAVFGQAVDTSMADLKGGTTGQILSKTTNTDMDFTWITNDVGDITAVTAGTGISGGGTSGAVTITNSMATEITASGDIIVGTGSGTFDNLPIGTTGQVLTADTTVSPYKVKWATSASGGMTVISTGTLSSTGVTFSSISGYKNLQLSVSGYTAGSGGQRLLVRCNGDTGSNYTGGYTRQRDGVILGGTYAASPGQSTSILTDGDVTPDNSGDASVTLTFFDYAATNGKKVITANAYALSTYQVPNNTFFAYTGTTGAITSITIAIAAGTFGAGTYTLYGVK
jgi:hypothetical protein